MIDDDFTVPTSLDGWSAEAISAHAAAPLDSSILVDAYAVERELLAEGRGAAPLPERRSVRQTFSEGQTVTREATDEEIPALVEHVRTRWNDPADAEMYSRRLDEWVHLDRAGVLVSEHPSRPGKPDIRAIRYRTTDAAGRKVAGLAQLTPGRRPESMQTTKAWMRAAGYHEVSLFVPEEFWGSPEYQAHAAAVGWRLKARHGAKFRRPLAEAVMVLD